MDKITMITKSTLRKARVDFTKLDSILIKLHPPINSLLLDYVKHVSIAHDEELDKITMITVLNTLSYYGILVIDDDVDKPVSTANEMFESKLNYVVDKDVNQQNSNLGLELINENEYDFVFNVEEDEDEEDTEIDIDEDPWL
jgi:recombinational DNA repair protein RecT